MAIELRLDDVERPTYVLFLSMSKSLDHPWREPLFSTQCVAIYARDSTQGCEPDRPACPPLAMSDVFAGWCLCTGDTLWTAAVTLAFMFPLNTDNGVCAL